MAKDATIVIRGSVDWAKVIGKARPYTGNPKYDKGPYWSIDITPDASSRKLLKQHGIDDKLRDPKGEKDTRKDSFLTLRVLEERADGTKNDPPKVVDARNNKWDDRLIGNGSVCDIKVKVKDYGAGTPKGAYLQAIRVLDLVTYESNDFDELSEDDAYFAAGTSDNEVDSKGASPEADDLDDDIPF